MVLVSGKKLLRLASTLYLLLAVIGAFATAESHAISDIIGGGSSSAGTYTAAKDAIDWLSEETGSVTKAGNTSFTPLRSGASRIYAQAEPCSRTLLFSESSFQNTRIDSVPCINKISIFKLLL